jgi:hypothetical protein
MPADLVPDRLYGSCDFRDRRKAVPSLRNRFPVRDARNVNRAITAPASRSLSAAASRSRSERSLASFEKSACANIDVLTASNKVDDIVSGRGLQRADEGKECGCTPVVRQPRDRLGLRGRREARERHDFAWGQSIRFRQNPW